MFISFCHYNFGLSWVYPFSSWSCMWSPNSLKVILYSSLVSAEKPSYILRPSSVSGGVKASILLISKSVPLNSLLMFHWFLKGFSLQGDLGGQVPGQIQIWICPQEAHGFLCKSRGNAKNCNGIPWKLSELHGNSVWNPLEFLRCFFNFVQESDGLPRNLKSRGMRSKHLKWWALLCTLKNLHIWLG